MAHSLKPLSHKCQHELKNPLTVINATQLREAAIAIGTAIASAVANVNEFITVFVYKVGDRSSSDGKAEALRGWSLGLGISTKVSFRYPWRALTRSRRSNEPQPLAQYGQNDGALQLVAIRRSRSAIKCT